ncbi:MAG: VIT1/CCC1 transporter family protein [Candidatus Diapherotrites archaeon]|nr:VIT1/CCC1 transporter family protein [Candidatus Diapherotrites archaeon]
MVEKKLLALKHGGQKNNRLGEMLYDVILGGQDGVVNVLGLTLGVASATNDSRIIIIAGIASTVAESLSMAAVAYTSSRANEDFYKKVQKKAEQEVLETPDFGRENLETIYKKKGFTGKTLSKIIGLISSQKKIWIKEIMQDELKETSIKSSNPVSDAIIVGLSSVVGSLIPITPFFFIPVSEAIPVSVVASIAVLFAMGAVKAKLTIGNWIKSGLEIAVIGTIAAILGYLVGAFLGVSIE